MSEVMIDPIQAALDEKARIDQITLNNAKWALKGCLLAIQPAYVIDEHNVDVLTACAHWITGLEHPALKPGKGLYLTGPVGTGKTDIMRALSAMMIVGGERDGFPIHNAKRIVKEHDRSDDGSKDRTRTGGPHVILKYAALRRLCIDEFGGEDEGKFYGKSCNVIADIIHFKYENFRNGQSLLMLTSNATPDQLMTKYDDRVLTRVTEQCNELYLGGPNRRPNAAPPRRQYVMPLDLFKPDKVDRRAEEVKQYAAPLLPQSTPVERGSKVAAVVAAIDKAMDGTSRGAVTAVQNPYKLLRSHLVGMSPEEIMELRGRMLSDAAGTGSADRFIERIDEELKKRNVPIPDALAEAHPTSHDTPPTP